MGSSLALVTCVPSSAYKWSGGFSQRSRVFAPPNDWLSSEVKQSWRALNLIQKKTSDAISNIANTLTDLVWSYIQSVYHIKTLAMTAAGEQCWWLSYLSSSWRFTSQGGRNQSNDPGPEWQPLRMEAPQHNRANIRLEKLHVDYVC